MSQQSVYVRARNNLLYRDPVLVFPEGFVCFDDRERPEVVLWLASGSADEKSNPIAVLERVFDADPFPGIAPQYGVDTVSVTPGTRSERVVPGSDPFEFRPAASYFFDVVNRIPVPLIHRGTERYTGRICKESLVLDWPAHPADASTLGLEP